MSGNTEAAPESLSKDGEEKLLQMYRDSFNLEERVAAGMMDLVKNCFFMHAVEITEVKIMKREQGWLLILKGARSGQKLVAFFNAKRFHEALLTCVTAADCNHVDWKVPKKPPWE